MSVGRVAAVPPAGPSNAQRSHQLDLFRGLAALFMVVNHAGYQLLGATLPGAGLADAAVFVGSTAPALFFFATGVGSGLGAGAGDRLGATARKVLLLLLADLFLGWSRGEPLGLDFFGFAAIATATLHAVRRSAHPVRLAIVLVLVVLALRFGLAVVAGGASAASGWVAFVTGNGAVRHVSYPLAPWLAFPLLGFLVGRHWRGALRGESLTLGAAALASLGAAAVLAARGAPVFRWGSVSLAWFMAALGIVALAWLASAGASRAWPAAVRALGLRGPASLLIVPLHYGFLGVLEAVVPPPWGLSAWWAAVMLLGLAVFGTSRVLVAGARTLPVPGGPVQALVALGAIAIALAALLTAPPLVRLEVCSAAEVAVAVLLLWSGGAAPRPRAS